MSKYYFLAASLPELHFGVKPELSFEEFQVLLKENLSEVDYAQTRRIRWLFDIHNIRAFWKQETFDRWGNLGAMQLEEDLIDREGALPSFVYQFLEDHEKLEERLQYFPLLFIRYFADGAANASGFLKTYWKFERDMRLVVTGFRARQLGRNLVKELQFEDPEDDLVAQLLAQKDAKTFEPPAGFEDLKNTLEENYKSPLELQKALFEYRYNKLQLGLGPDVFSIDYILMYMVIYIMIDKWLQLDRNKGIEIIDNIVKEIA